MVTRYQLLSLLSETYIESAKLHREAADADMKASRQVTEEISLMSVAEAERLVEIADEKIPESMLHLLRQEA